MSDQDFYQVEKIVDKRLRNGIEEYRIRWKDYSPSADTWEREENCLGCYNLIVVYEAIHFDSLQKFQPKITAVKVYHKRIKLLVEWKTLKEKQYYYSFAIRLINPTALIEFYEKHISDRVCDEKLKRFHHSLKESEDISDDWEPERIIAVANGLEKRMYYIAWKHKEEASIVSDVWIKANYPGLLVEFYEKYLFL